MSDYKVITSLEQLEHYQERSTILNKQHGELKREIQREQQEQNKEIPKEIQRHHQEQNQEIQRQFQELKTHLPLDPKIVEQLNKKHREKLAEIEKYMIQLHEQLAELAIETLRKTLTFDQFQKMVCESIDLGYELVGGISVVLDQNTQKCIYSQALVKKFTKTIEL